jgi:hypothetical protein
MATRDRSASICVSCSKNEIKSRSLCGRCYQRFSKSGELNSFPLEPPRIKSQCKNHPTRLAVARKLCDSCYRIVVRGCPTQRARIQRYEKHRNKQLREQAIKFLGGICKCCGYTWLPALCIDHPNGDGARRRRGGEPTGDTLYLGIISGKFLSSDFQILCANCNIAKGIKLKCPHETEVLQML